MSGSAGVKVSNEHDNVYRDCSKTYLADMSYRDRRCDGGRSGGLRKTSSKETFRLSVELADRPRGWLGNRRLGAYSNSKALSPPPAESSPPISLQKPKPSRTIDTPPCLLSFTTWRTLAQTFMSLDVRFGDSYSGHHLQKPTRNSLPTKSSHRRTIRAIQSEGTERLKR